MSDSQPVTRLDQLAVAYLTLPLVIFIAVAVVPALSGLLTAAVVAALWPFFHLRAPWDLQGSIGVGLIIALAVGWSILGGSGHLVYANSDWLLRDAVLGDLTAYGWPSVYSNPDGGFAMLRAPVGYYMVPAYAARLLGLSPQLTIGLWTAVGSSLFLLMVTRGISSPGKKLTIAVLVIFSAGADVIGTILAGKPVTLTQHLQWWNDFFQYSSVTTLMFWVPNHALPGWLGLLLIWRLQDSTVFARVGGLVLVAAALWSPFAALGLVPYAGLVAFKHIKRGTWRSLLSWGNLLVSPLSGLVVVLTLTVATAGIHQSGVIHHIQLLALIPIFLTFNLLPLVVIPLCLGWRMDRWGWVSIISLVVIPFYGFGPSNDFCDRTSIPALTYLAVVTARQFCRFNWTTALENPLRAAAASLAVSLLLIGAVTPATELARAVLLPRWVADPHTNAAVASDGAAHYIAPVEAFKALRILRTDNDSISQ